MTEQGVIAILRAELETKAGEVVEARDRIANLEQSQVKIDALVAQAADAFARSTAISDDWKDVARRAAELSDNLLIANAQVEVAETKERSATFALVGLEERLDEVRQELRESQAVQAEATAQWQKLKTKSDQSAAEIKGLETE